MQKKKIDSILHSKAIIAVVLLGLFFGFSVLRQPSPLKAPRIVQSSATSNSLFFASNREFSVKIGEKTTNKPVIEYSLPTGNKVSFSYRDIKGKQVEPTEKNNTITFKNVSPNVDLRYTTLPNGLKEEIILNKQATNNIFTFDLSATNAFPEAQTSSLFSGVFKDSKGNYLFHFQKPYASDAKGNRTDNVATQIKKDLKSNTYFLALAVDRKWLESKDRAFPIVIDPTIVHDTTAEFAAGQFNRVADVGTGFITNATGGTIATASGYTIHTFTAGGTFTPGNAGNVEVLVVGGGGGTGSVYQGGGGGGGGIVYNSSYGVTTTPISVTVGNGGNGSAIGAETQTSGGDSIFGNMTAYGGGRGGSENVARLNGGSGGGSSHNIDQTASSATQGTNGSARYGNGGGATAQTGVSPFSAAGGGGAGAVGASVSESDASPGAGGIGVAFNISGSTLYYGGGGAGSNRSTTTAAGGLGGGGATGTAGTANTGGGGGAGSQVSTPTRIGGAGGSGIVIVRYPTGPSLTTYYQELPADNNTAGLWHMNNNWNDSSGNSNTLSATGNATFSTTSKLGSYSGTFDSSGDYVSIASNASLNFGTNPFSIEAWIKSTSVFQQKTIILKRTTAINNMYWLSMGFSAAGKINFFTRDAAGTTVQVNSNALVNDGVWHHIAAIRNLNDVSIYIDGILDNSVAGTAVNTDNAEAFVVGEDVANGATTSWDGQIDEVRISNIARTPEEIKLDAQRRPYSVYTSDVLDLTNASVWNSFSWTELGVNTGDGETPYSSTNLVAQWNFNETSGTTAVSGGSCGTACNLTLTNFTSTGSQDSAAGTGWTSANRRWGTGALMFLSSASNLATCTDANCGGTSKLDMGTSDWTLETWYKPNNIGTNHTLINKDPDGSTAGYYLLITSTGKVTAVQLLSGGLSATSNTILQPGNWYHIVASYKRSSDLSLYINGKLEASTDISSKSGSNDSTARFTIGADGGGANPMNGTMDITRIYSRALTASEILSNYQAGNLELQTRVGGTTNANDGSWEAWRPVTGETAIDSMDGPYEYKTTDANLVSYWPLDETSGSSVADVKGSNSTTATGTSIVGGKFGKARSFNGSSDKVNLGAISFSGSMTFSYWTRPGSTTGYLMSRWKSSEWQFNSGWNGTNYYCGIRTSTNGDIWVQAAGSGNKWTNLTCVANAATTSLTMYLDGVQAATRTDWNGTWQTTTSDIYLGFKEDSVSYASGVIDEVRIFNAALSASTIYQYANIDSTRPDQLLPSTDITTKMEGSGSLKLTSGAPQVDANTVALWHLDETGGTGAYLKDSTANANNGTPTGTTVANGFFEKARSFNGTNSDYVTVTDNANLGSALMTVEAWVYPKSFISGAPIYNRRTSGTNIGGTTVELNGTAGSVSCYFYIGGAWRVATSTSLLSLNKWNHIACTYDGLAIKPYINGVLDATTGQYSGTINNPASPTVLIGQNIASTTTVWNGYIDEVRISNVPRSAEEIAEAYRAGRDHYLNKTISSTDLFGKTTLPFYVASDRQGTFLNATIGESAFANYLPDANTVGLWHMDDQQFWTKGGEYVYDATSIAAHYTLNESTAIDTVDSSGNGYTLTNSSSTVVGGKFGYARSFNGTSDYLYRAAADTTNTANWALDGWIYPTNINQLGFAVYNGHDSGGYGFGVGNGAGAVGAKLQVLFGGVAWFDCGYTFPAANAWYHIVVTRDSTTTRCYVNGSQTANTSASVPAAVGAKFSIGMEYNAAGTATRFFAGYVDEVKVYSRALTATEIAYDNANNVGINYIKDSSGNGNNGDGTTTVTSVQGKIGKARRFNGTSDYINLGTGPTLQQTGSMTISSWIKAESGSSSNYRAIISKENNAGSGTSYRLLLITTTSKPSFDFSGGASGSLTGTTSLNDNNWHYVAVTRDDSAKSINLYIDGVLNATGSYSGTITGGAEAPWIGRSPYAGGNYPFLGIIDEVSLSNTVRTADQIRQAYEVGARTHNITIDFKAKLDSGNLITGTSDLSFTIDATAYGASAMGSNLFLGDKIIVKENYDGTEYIAQGTVNGLTPATGAVTVAVWDTGSTVPSGGFTVNATIFKWQREYFDIRGSRCTADTDAACDRYATTNITLRETDGSQGSTVWLDDFRSNSGYLTTPGGSTITSSLFNRYFQYRAIPVSYDTAVSPSLTSVTLDYTSNVPPNLPTLDLPTDAATNQSILPILKTTATDNDSDSIKYKINLCTNVGMSVGCKVFDQTSTTTGWSNTSYASGAQGIYTIQAADILAANTTYYWKSLAIDPAGTNTWGPTQTTPYSFTTTQTPSAPSGLLTNGVTNNPTADISNIYFSAVHSDPNGDTANYYRIEVNTNNTFTGTVMWDSTKTAFGSPVTSGATTPDISYGGSALTTNTTYYWRITLWDSNDASATSATAQFTTNTTPTTPTFGTPADTATDIPVAAVLKTTSTDADSNYLRYKILLCTNVGMTLGCQTFDQTSSQTGWSGQNADSGLAYTSGTEATYTVQVGSLLSPNTTYYWKTYAIDPAGVNVWSATQVTPRSFTTSQVPNTPSLDSPIDTATDQPLSPVLKTTATDPDGDTIKYKIQLCKDVGMTTDCQVFDQTVSSTGWSAGSYASGVQGIYTIQTPLIAATTYYWRSYAIDQTGSQTWSATQGTPYSFTTSSIPNTVTLLTPTNTATNVSITPAFTFSTTDADSDYLRYKLIICKNVSMSSYCQTFDQTSSQTNWSGQDADGGLAYASGTTATYNDTTLLDTNTLYYWQAFAIDPAGSNTWSSAPIAFSFTTQAVSDIPSPCNIVKAPDNSNITVNWTDTATEQYFQVWKITDGGLPVQFGSDLAANTISVVDSSIILNHSYAYMIRGKIVDGANTLYSAWCSTSTTFIAVGSFMFDALKMSGLKIN